MNKATQPHPEDPRVSEAPSLLADTADLLRALAYTEDTYDRTRLRRIAKTFIATHAPELGAKPPSASRQRAWQIDHEWERGLWTDRRSA